MTDDSAKTYEALSIGAWIAVGILILNVSYFVGEAVGGIWYATEADLLAMFNGFWIGLIKAMPTILMAWAISDFALLFGRCGEGQVFTERNLKTLRSGGDALILAAVWSAVFGPNLLRWMTGDPGGFDLAFRDLALGVGLMGAAIHGLAFVFRDALALKQENDEFL